MLSVYRAVFRAPGSAAFSAASFVLRMPIALYPLGLVLLVSAREGHYGFAGIVSAAYIAGGVPGQPVLGRLIDRYGQRALLVPASALHVAAVVVLGVLVESGAPDWTLLLPTFVTGFAYLPAGSMVRARWSLALAGRPELTTAYSLESTLDELIFVIGPLIATLIATSVDPVWVFVVAIALVSAGSAWLFTQRATEPPRRPHDAPPHPSALRARGMPLLVGTAISLGVLFASAEISMVAFAGQHGHRGLSGVVVAVFAGGSGVAGFVYGTVGWRVGVLTRFRLHAVVFGGLTALFLAAWNIPVLLVVAFLIGLAIAPTLITAFGLIERLVAAPALTEGLSWLTTGLNIGYGAGAAVVGGIADAHGARLAFLVTVAAGIATAVQAVVLHARLGGRLPDGSGAGAADPSEVVSSDVSSEGVPVPRPGDPGAAVAPSQHAALP